jgi:hypothetical protein
LEEILMQVRHWMLIAGLALTAPLMAACDNNAPKEEQPAGSEESAPPAEEPAAIPPAEETPAAPAEEAPSEEGESE